MLKNKKNTLFILFFFGLILADQTSTYLIRHSGGFYICNKGIAFGISAQYVILWIFIISIVYFSYQILNGFSNLKLKSFNLIENLKFKIENYKAVRIAIIFVISGALSNILDRITHGCITDFIDLKIWPVFNLADIFIVLGVIMLIIGNFKFKILNLK